MFRNKQLLPLLLSLMLVGCASGSQGASGQSEEELLLNAVQNVAENQTPDGTIKTTTVQRSDLTATYSVDAVRLYPFGEEIVYANAYATVTLEQCLVEAGEFVKAGQELFVLHQSMSEIDAEEVRRTYARESAAYEITCADYENRLSELEKDQNAYNCLAYEYEIYQEETLKELSELAEEIAAYDQIRENPEVILTAPFDGYVESVINRIKGEKISADEVLMQLQDISVWYYTLDDMAQTVPIGKDVLIYSDSSQERSLEITGYVVCADMALGGDEKKGYALVRANQVTADGENVAGQFDPAMLPEQMKAKLCQMELNNVLAVPKDYVHQEGEKRYVYRLENGTQVKTYVVCMADNVNGSSWILSGVEEGDVLALN